MSDPSKPLAYRLTPVYPPPPNALVTAAVMECEATGQILCGMGGGGVYISPEFYQRIKAGEFRPHPSAVIAPEPEGS